MDVSRLENLSKDELIKIIQSGKSQKVRPQVESGKAIKHLVAPPANRAKQATQAKIVEQAMDPRYAFIDDGKPKPISAVKKALKGHTKSYKIEIVDKLEPLVQLNTTRWVAAQTLEQNLTEM